ncbi:MAG: S41 family peptidase [Gemmatimonadota bacterium]
MKLVFTLCSVISMALPVAAPGQAEPPADSPVTIERLAGLARVWGFAKYFHPVLAYRTDIDWDSALIAAIPGVRSARTSPEYAAALNVMLGRLHDPLTRAHVASASAPDLTADTIFSYRVTPGRVLVVTVGDYYSLFDPSVQQKLTAAAEALHTARGVVLDLRSRRPVDPYGRFQLSGMLSDFERMLTRDTLLTPGQRHRVYYGYDSPSAFSSGQYRTGLMVENGNPLLPLRNARNIPVVILMNPYSGELTATTAMQAAGKAFVVFEGDPDQRTAGDLFTIQLPGGVIADIRQSEPIFQNGRSAELTPDLVVRQAASGTGDPALTRAIALASQFRAPQPASRRLPVVAAYTRERSYADQSPPSLELRLLAAFRLWTTIDFFHPYKALMDQPWDSVLTAFIPRFEQATTAEEYAQVVARMAARITDSHVYLAGSLASKYLISSGYPPVRIRQIEDRLIVTFLFDTLAAERAGIEVGDEVVTLDDKPAWELLEETAGYISASNRQNQLDKATLAFTSGPEGSSIALGLRDRSGQPKSATLERRHEDFNTLYHRERRGEVISVLPGNVGYVDMDRLRFDMIDSMFNQLAATRAIIFDMRGYPMGTIWAIAPRLTDSSRVVALIGTPMLGHRSPGPAVETVMQTVDPDTVAAHYRGRVFMLMDERSMSQAEHTGLYLKAVSGATFVGSATGGTDGEITTTVLPGGITVGFTGQSIRFPDGRQVQRVGLQPDVEVHPTVAGIRAGRDEVLEAALRLAARE